jgi:hypothetical protein
MVRLKSCTIWSSALLDAVVKFVSPEYTSVMECEPTARVEIASVAIPLELTVPVPRGVVPSRKVTVPVGVLTVEFTVAVSVMEFCTSTGFEFEVAETPAVALAITSVPVAVP